MEVYGQVKLTADKVVSMMKDLVEIFADAQCEAKKGRTLNNVGFPMKGEEMYALQELNTDDGRGWRTLDVYHDPGDAIRDCNMKSDKYSENPTVEFRVIKVLLMEAY